MVEPHIGDVVGDETADPREEVWTLCIDAASKLGLDNPQLAAELACDELGYPLPGKRKRNSTSRSARTIALHRLAPVH